MIDQEAGREDIPADGSSLTAMSRNPILSDRSLISNLISLSDHFSWSLGIALISVRADEETTEGARVAWWVARAFGGVTVARRGAAWDMQGRW